MNKKEGRGEWLKSWFAKVRLYYLYLCYSFFYNRKLTTFLFFFFKKVQSLIICPSIEMCTRKTIAKNWNRFNKEKKSN